MCAFRYLLLLIAVYCALYCTASDFLRPTYRVRGVGVRPRFRVRQVPGDGNCLFHAISAWLNFIERGEHTRFDSRCHLTSLQLRLQAVDVLSTSQQLFVEKDEEITTDELVSKAADLYGFESSEYLRQMKQPGTWGGGPEIVALCHHLQRPIHCYRLCIKGLFRRSLGLECIGAFGSPRYNDKQPFFILSVDGRYSPRLPIQPLLSNGEPTFASYRFPNIAAEDMKTTGDHFMALFPASLAPPISDEDMDVCDEFNHRHRIWDTSSWDASSWTLYHAS